MRKGLEDFGKLWELNPTWDLLTTEEKSFIAANSEIKRYRKNEMIHREGDVSTHVMMVVDGTVRLSKEGVGQRVQIIRLLKPHDMFGYRSAIVGDKHSSCAATIEPTVLYRIRRDAFLNVVKSNNAFCFGVLTAMAKDLAISESRTVNLTQKHIRGRLAESLLTLRQTYSSRQRYSYPLPVRHRRTYQHRWPQNPTPRRRGTHPHLPHGIVSFLCLSCLSSP